MGMRAKLGPSTAIAGAVVGGILLSTGVMWQASSAAFTATTSNAVNNWAAGTVSLADDDNTTAMFNASNLRPGSTGTKCIRLTYSGSLSTSVKLYGTSVTGALAPHLDLVVEEGDGGTFADCTGFVASGTAYSGTLANFGATRTNFATGVGSFAPTGNGQTRTYRFTYTVNAATPDSAQGATASGGFTWEASS
jgi:hypothetical protein